MNTILPFQASRARPSRPPTGPAPCLAPSAFALGPDGLQRGAAYSPRAAEGLEPLAWSPGRGVYVFAEPDLEISSVQPDAPAMVAAAPAALPPRRLARRALILQLLLIGAALAVAAVRVKGWPL